MNDSPAAPPSEPAVDALAEVWASVLDATERVEPVAWEHPTDCPGWTVRDQLSHLIGIERMLLGESAPSAPAPLPRHVRNPIGEVNEAWVEARRDQPGDQVRAEFADVAARRLADLRGMEPERFDVVGWSPLGDMPYREFMTMRVFDSWVHEQDIRHALGSPGGRGGAGEVCTVDRVTSALGFVVGRKVRPPDATTVEFAVEGRTGREVAVTMSGGRGVLGDAASGSPPAAVRLELDAEWFWMLGCGRRSAEDAERSEAVVLRGDRDLGRRVLQAMNFMI